MSEEIILSNSKNSKQIINRNNPKVVFVASAAELSITENTHK